MAIFTVGALLVGAVLTYFTVGALATLAHWISVAGAFLVFAGLTYNIISQDWFEFLGFESELLEKMGAAVFSAAVAGVSFRLFEAVFATAGSLFALVAVVLAGASVVFGAGTVISFIVSFVTVVNDLIGGGQK